MLYMSGTVTYEAGFRISSRLCLPQVLPDYPVLLSMLIKHAKAAAHCLSLQLCQQHKPEAVWQQTPRLHHSMAHNSILQYTAVTRHCTTSTHKYHTTMSSPLAWNGIGQA